MAIPIKVDREATLERLIDGELETLVIACILWSGETFFREANLSEDDFATERPRLVFRAMRDIVDEIELTPPAVAARLVDQGQMDKVGFSWIVDLDNKAIKGMSIASLAGTLRKLARKRRAWRISALISEELTLGANADDERLQQLSSELAELTAKQLSAGDLRIETLPAVATGCAGIQYVREPELPESSVIALTGDSGSGKSTLATAWARDAIAQGVPVLIVDRETPQPVAIDRMARLELADSPLLRWWGGWLGEVPSPGSPEIMRWVKGCNPKPIVIVDSLAAFLEADENSASEMRAFMHQSRRLADLGATVVVIHHDGKSETARDYRGSTDFKASVDAGFHVSNIGPDSRLDRLSLRCFKSRHGFVGSLVYLYAGGRFVRDERHDAPAITVGEQLTALLRLNPGIGAKKFENLAHEKRLGRNRARDFIVNGVLAGTIRRENLGGNRSAHYLAEGQE